MDVDVRLVCFATNLDNPNNSYVLLKNSFDLPAYDLHNGEKSLLLVYKMLKESLGIEGHWKETRPDQVGFFEGEENSVVYSLYLPGRLPAIPPYEWVPLDQAHDSKDYTVIRYSALKEIINVW